MPLPDLPYVLTDDATSVSLAFPRAMTENAKGVEGLILFLAGVRARMAPEFPTQPPMLDEDSHLIGDPCMSVRADGEAVMLSVLHPGCGWFRFRLDRGQVLSLHEVLLKASAATRDQTKH